MKKIISLFLIFVFIFILFLLLPIIAEFVISSNNVTKNNNTIYSINMNVFIDNYGDATIIEVWHTNAVEGTEWYKSFSDLNFLDVTHFSVSDESGEYKYKTWDTSDTFSEKAYKYGYNSKLKDIELCWGISNYGDNTYTISYKINDFVTQFTDSQGIYFNLLSMDMDVENVKITINSYFDFTKNNSSIWGFGFDGDIDYSEGSVVIETSNKLSTSEYILILAKLESNFYITSNETDETFESIYNGIYEEKNSNFEFALTCTIRIFLLLLLNYVILIISSRVSRFSNYNSNVTSSNFDFGVMGKRIPRNIDYFRDIPCHNNLERAYWIAYYYQIVNPLTLQSGLIGAILLKWEKNNLITITKSEKKKKNIFNFKKDSYEINLLNMSSGFSMMENKLYNILLEASGSNGILETDELTKWCNNNYGKIENWFEELLYEKRLDLEREGLIVKEEKVKKSLLGEKTTTTRRIKSNLYEEAAQLKGLKRFLLDYSIISKREHVEVHTWDDYLIFATLLGVASKVEKQLKKIYPDFNQVSYLNIRMASNCIDFGHSSISVGNHYYSGSSGGRSRSSHGGGSHGGRGGSSARGSSGGGSR